MTPPVHDLMRPRRPHSESEKIQPAITAHHTNHARRRRHPHLRPKTLCDHVDSVDDAEQLVLQDVFPLLVLLGRLESLVVLPAHRLLALLAADVAHDVSARGHVALDGIRQDDVDDVVEQVGLAVLASEVLRLSRQPRPSW